MEVTPTTTYTSKEHLNREPHMHLPSLLIWDTDSISCLIISISLAHGPATQDNSVLKSSAVSREGYDEYLGTYYSWGEEGWEYHNCARRPFLTHVSSTADLPADILRKDKEILSGYTIYDPWKELFLSFFVGCISTLTTVLFLYPG